MEIELKEIDENTVEYNGNVYTAVESNGIIDCDTCPLAGDVCCQLKVPCSSQARKDKRDIVWQIKRKMMIEFLIGDQWHEFTKLTGMQYPTEGRISSFKKFALVAIEVDKEAFGPRIKAYRITEILEEK